MQIDPQVISEPANPDADIRLREFAYQLAKTHKIETSHFKFNNPPEGLKNNRNPPGKPSGRSFVVAQKTDLLEHLKAWELALRNANAIFKSVPANDAPVSRAGEWMLDNFYIVKQTLRQIEEDLPASFLNELPKLESGHPRPVQEPGLPRIFALAREWVNYSQSQIDLGNFGRCRSCCASGFWSGLFLLHLN